jgi:ATPase subunit of ABC transporter with duplicated ATPase domains
VWDHPHILILDEISTHLDFDTIRALGDALIEFDGAVVLVSHDRYLLKALTEANDSDTQKDDFEYIRKATRHSAMYLLRKKKLELVQSGVSGIEEQLTKVFDL